MRNSKLAAACVTLGLAMGVSVGCTPVTQPGASTSVSYTDQATGKVVSIDKQQRQMAVQFNNGPPVQIAVSPDVRNFTMIQVGDTVRVSYYARVDFQVAGMQAPVEGVIEQGSGVRAPAGQMPAALLATQTQRSVQIVSVDRTTHTVTFKEPDGSVYALVVQNPANYALADGLQPGTYVVVTETQVVAVSADRV